jgi:ABC-type sugar transport system substrate-binding protein
MKPWVLVSLHSDKQEYQLAQADDARRAADKAGLEVRVTYFDSDPKKQVQQISEVVAAAEGLRPVAVVAETAGSVGFERMARTALEAGVGWVLASDNPRYLDSLHREFPGKIVSSACANHEEMGRLLGRMAAALLPSGGKLLVVEGPTATAATLQRRRGLEDGIRGSKTVIGKTLGADWTSGGAGKAVEFWLKLAGKSAQRPDLLVSFNDEMAVGALGALEHMHPEWGKITAVGCDGLPEGGQRLVREGVLAATIVMPTTAGACIELVARAMHGEEIPITTSIPVRPFPTMEGLTGHHHP